MEVAPQKDQLEFHPVRTVIARVALYDEHGELVESDIKIMVYKSVDEYEQLEAWRPKAKDPSPDEDEG